MKLIETINAATQDGVSVDIGINDVSESQLADFTNNGYLVHVISLAKVTAKQEFFDTIGDKLEFPSSVVGLDGFDDWFGDLAWFNSAGGHIIVFSGLAELDRTLPEAINWIAASAVMAGNTMRRGSERFHVLFLSESPHIVIRLAEAVKHQNDWLAEASSSPYARQTGPVTLINHASAHSSH